jgi:hypothetical protein
MLYRKLIQIEERPGLFSCETVEALFSFIQGYGYALEAIGHQDPDFIKFDAFGKFVKRHYKLQGLKANWALVIRVNSASQQEALANFFILLEQFKSGG